MMAAPMDWRINPGVSPSDPHGVADLIVRVCPPDGSGPIDGTRFEFRTTQMVRASRAIERAALLEPDVPLYVGVQLGFRLDAQREVYAPLLAAGVAVHAFGTDDAPELDVDWTRVDDDPRRIESQWFVVREGREPAALVGFEVGHDHGRRRRVWEGFQSTDPRLVARLASHLAGVRAAHLTSR